MAQRDYGQFFDASRPGQTDEDDWRIASPVHPLLIACQFTIYWIPSLSTPIAGTATMTIVSIGTSPFDLFRLLYSASTDQIVVVAPGISNFGGAITFTALSEIRFDVDGVAGTVTVSGALTGNGVFTGATWAANMAALSVCRIGGNFNVDSESALGWVSLPYARVETGIGTTGGAPLEVLTLDGDNLTLDGDDLELA